MYPLENALLLDLADVCYIEEEVDIFLVGEFVFSYSRPDCINALRPRNSPAAGYIVIIVLSFNRITRGCDKNTDSLVRPDAFYILLEQEEDTPQQR